MPVVANDLDAMIKLFYPMWVEQYQAWAAAGNEPPTPPLQEMPLEQRLEAIREADERRSAEINAQRDKVLAEVGVMPSTGGVDAPNPQNPAPPAALDPPGPFDESRPGAAEAAATAEAAGAGLTPQEVAHRREAERAEGGPTLAPDHTPGTPLSSNPPQATPPLRRGT